MKKKTKTEKKQFTMVVKTTGRATATFDWEGEDDPTDEEAWAVLMSDEKVSDSAKELEWSFEEIESVGPA